MPFVSSSEPPTLVPQKKMGRNEKCWCLSQKKWKNCHSDKNKKAPMKISDGFSVEKESISASSECLHPNKCHNKPISSHTVQKSIGLNAISRDNHVMTFMTGLNGVTRNEGRLKATKKGIKTASTFPGFCSAHDGELFAPIETKEWINCKENAFLFSLRAASYEIYSKKRSLFSAEFLKENADNGKEFHEQIEIQNKISVYIYGIKMGIQDGKLWKKSYDECYLSGNYHNYHYLSIETKTPLPICGCGAFHVDYDFEGNLLQDLMETSKNIQHLTINATSNLNRGLIVFGWIGDPNGPARKFLESFEKIPQDQKINSVIKIFFEYIENTYFKEEWWESLSDQDRFSIENRVNYTAKMNDRKPNALKEDSLDLFQCEFTNSGIVI
ncbi:SEC-C metal-binding domain-containing protein [Gluconobacter cadivus]|uniref:Uncharacterized protein n=1 Tax=Gluconobacter cadivus TaxID=2728101 RepID=A0ABR9YT89_9PROT|nr:SEC-C metal-binding domain-containing protein [Gluconobacter cadivus]MBF0887726.1 hypothetical protein [Gluconobacter cadivus]